MFFVCVLQERPKFGARLVRIKKNQDTLVQNCDVYIGHRVSNSYWHLPRSDWANWFNYKDEHRLDNYAAYIRRRMWHRLDELEGKLIGCWCDDLEECHGSVLVSLLEQKKMKKVKSGLSKAGLLVEPDDLAEMITAFDWAKDELFLAYATRLDRTNIFYFQPEIFEAIKCIWGVVGPKYWRVMTNEGKIYYVVGLYDGLQPIGPFWSEGADMGVLRQGSIAGCESMPQVNDIFAFAKSLQTHLIRKPSEFGKSLKSALKYHTLHRCVVKRVGCLTGVDMADHDLTKSRIVHLALAYAYHWEGGERDDQLLAMAGACVRAGHCSQENHHPEYFTAGNGAVDVNKLLVDRVSVHVQKDPDDYVHGWGVADQWIPRDMKEMWTDFKNTHKHKDLYSGLSSKPKRI